MYGIKGQKKIILYDQECQPTKSNLNSLQNQTKSQE